MEKAKEIIKKKKKSKREKRRRWTVLGIFGASWSRPAQPSGGECRSLSLSPARHSFKFEFKFKFNVFSVVVIVERFLSWSRGLLLVFIFVYLSNFFFGCLLHHSVSRCASRSVFRGFRCTLFEGCWYLRWDPCWDPFGILEGGGPGVWV